MDKEVSEITDNVEELNAVLKESKNTTEKYRLRMLYLPKVEKRKRA